LPVSPGRVDGAPPPAMHLLRETPPDFGKHGVAKLDQVKCVDRQRCVAASSAGLCGMPQRGRSQRLVRPGAIRADGRRANPRRHHCRIRRRFLRLVRCPDQRWCSSMPSIRGARASTSDSVSAAESKAHCMSHHETPNETAASVAAPPEPITAATRASRSRRVERARGGTWVVPR
jgi:hypothetical protein